MPEIAGLHVREAGTGFPLVLVHAFPLDGRLYGHLLEAPPEGFRVLAPDLPGFGSSPARTIASIDDYAQAVLGVLDAEGIDRCVVGGTSMGGYVVFALVRAARERFAGLVLSDTRAGPDSEEGKRAREEGARKAEREGSAAIVEDLLPRLLGPRTLQGKPDVVAEVRRIGAESDPSGLAAAQRAMAARPDSASLLRRIDVPTLIIVGSDDPITGPAEAEAMHAAIPRSLLVEIEEAGHLPALETPERFMDALDAFLERIR